MTETTLKFPTDQLNKLAALIGYDVHFHPEMGVDAYLKHMETVQTMALVALIEAAQNSRAGMSSAPTP